MKTPVRKEEKQLWFEYFTLSTNEWLHILLGLMGNRSQQSWPWVSLWTLVMNLHVIALSASLQRNDQLDTFIFFMHWSTRQIHRLWLFRRLICSLSFQGWHLMGWFTHSIYSLMIHSPKGRGGWSFSIYKTLLMFQWTELQLNVILLLKNKYIA